MPSELDTSAWTGEGSFTQLVIDRLRELDAVRLVPGSRMPATRSDADYNFISNEVYVGFATVDRQERVKRFGVLPGSRTVTEKVMTLSGLEAVLTGIDGVGAPDYGDEGMLQYLRAERIIPPYQTKGYNSSRWSGSTKSAPRAGTSQNPSLFRRLKPDEQSADTDL
jgi:hypothetical protein